jgi:hydrocephalus-inducing protein
LFFDDVFVVQPVEGHVWPNSFLEVTVFFQPDKPGSHQKTIYCEISGRETRLPLQLQGDAIGAQARFSYDLLEIEEVFINTSHRYEVTLENTGEIDIRFAVVPKESLFGPKFVFEPSTGLIPVDSSISVQVDFLPDVLGDFMEEFTWSIEVRRMMNPRFTLLFVQD